MQRDQLLKRLTSHGTYLEKGDVTIFKKTGLLLVILTVVCSLSFAEISIVVDNNDLDLDVSPQLVDGRTMVPMSAIFEALDVNPVWDGPNNTVRAETDRLSLTLPIGSREANLNGKTVVLDVPAMLIEGRTMVPTRFIAESLGAEVKWEASSQTVIIQNTSVEPIVLGAQEYDLTARFHNAVAKVIIERGYEIPCETKLIVQGSVLDFLEMKDEFGIDLTMSEWIPSMTENQYESYIAQDKVTELATNYSGTMQGLYVPAYLIEGNEAPAQGLKTVKDLKNHSALFAEGSSTGRGKIYVHSLSGMDYTIALKLYQYGLDDHYEVEVMDSVDHLEETVSQAYEQEEAFVFLGHEPSVLFGKFNFTLLEDAAYDQEDFNAGIGAFPTYKTTVCVEEGFEEQYPDVTEFLKSYNTPVQVSSEALAYIKLYEAGPKEAAMMFLKHSPEVWSPMVPEEVANKVESAIE